MLLTEEEKQKILDDVLQDFRKKRFLSAKVTVQESIQEKLTNNESENLALLQDFIMFLRKKYTSITILSSVFILQKFASSKTDIDKENTDFFIKCSHAIWGKNILCTKANTEELLSIVSEPIDYSYANTAASNNKPSHNKPR